MRAGSLVSPPPLSRLLVRAGRLCHLSSCVQAASATSPRACRQPLPPLLVRAGSLVSPPPLSRLLVRAGSLCHLSSCGQAASLAHHRWRWYLYFFIFVADCMPSMSQIAYPQCPSACSIYLFWALVCLQLIALACTQAGVLPSNSCTVDMCAGRGGKTCALAMCGTDDSATTVTYDIDPNTVRDLRVRLARSSCAHLCCVADENTPAAVAQAVSEHRQQYEKQRLTQRADYSGGVADVVLVDAPCSRLGILRRGYVKRRCSTCTCWWVVCFVGRRCLRSAHGWRVQTKYCACSARTRHAFACVCVHIEWTFVVMPVVCFGWS